jgi:hypothetical protein
MSQQLPSFTGLPPGPEHDGTVEYGSDFVVIKLEFSDELPDDSYLCMLDPGVDVLTTLLKDLDWMEWVRVRALSPESALERHIDAYDQCVAKVNGSPRWQDVPLYAWHQDGEIRERIIEGG